MDNIYVQETYLNQTKGWIIGESDVYETYTDSKAELFRDMQKEYGRCVGKAYVGDGIPVGWVFEKTMQYEDSTNKYVQEVWVTLHKAPPTKTIEYHYAEEG